MIDIFAMPPSRDGLDGSATVRDTDGSVEVIILRQIKGRLMLLPWIGGGAELNTDYIPDCDTVQLIAGCSLRLPRWFCSRWQIGKTIAELEKHCSHIRNAWRDSKLLRGELFLILDENLSAELCGKILKYDERLGLLSGGNTEEYGFDTNL